MPKPAIAIANDYEVVVRGLAAILAAHTDLVDVVELEAGYPVERPVDVILYDVFGAGEGHTTEVEDVIANPLVGALAVFSANAHPDLVTTALGMGARGYLSKELSGRELAEAIVRIHAGEQVVALRSRSSQPPPERTWPGQAEHLSEREAEVLALLTRGFDNAEIGRRLFLSVNTVKTRIRHLYRKMGWDNRVHAAVWGVHHGFLGPEGVLGPAGWSKPVAAASRGTSDDPA